MGSGFGPVGEVDLGDGRYIWVGEWYQPNASGVHVQLGARRNGQDQHGAQFMLTTEQARQLARLLLGEMADT